ncbi:MAG TPA: DNA polymerase III subunit epsilon [Alphaproteobacteria bacterium]|nr:DNA polymerase III subunit epsilon [Alphaproteobacteria bacterium]
MREIVLDTETTGLDPAAGDRVVEVACLELVNHLPTGASFQRYLNPERAMSADVTAIHGLTDAFLADKPKFPEIAQELLDFLGDAQLVIHNAEFDLRFLNAELGKIALPALPPERAIDTLALARRKFPGASASLDALCKRFNIDTSARNFHGALIDCDLLSKVYLELVGGRQASLGLAGAGGTEARAEAAARGFRPARPHAPSAEELEAHERMLKQLEKPLWLD